MKRFTILLVTIASVFLSTSFSTTYAEPTKSKININKGDECRAKVLKIENNEQLLMILSSDNPNTISYSIYHIQSFSPSTKQLITEGNFKNGERSGIRLKLNPGYYLVKFNCPTIDCKGEADMIVL